MAIFFVASSEMVSQWNPLEIGFELGLNGSSNGFTTTRNRGCGEAANIAAEKVVYQATVA